LERDLILKMVQLFHSFLVWEAQIQTQYKMQVLLLSQLLQFLLVLLML
jgi:hypothetical protein